MSRLELSEVMVSINRVPILTGVDLSLADGEWVGLLGPNGAGKTTLLRAITGTVPTQGRIVLDGLDLPTMTARGRASRIAVVPQRPFLPPELTVADYVLLGRTPHISYLGVEGPRDLAATAEAIAELDLSGYESRRLATLSGGEAQRAVLARALAQQSPLLLLDEPTASLDIGHQQTVLELVERLRRQRGLTVLSALHDLTLAGQFCDRLVMLAGGRVVAEGRAEVVLDETTIRRHYGANVRVWSDGDGIVVTPVRGRSTQPDAAGPAKLNP